MAVDPESRDGGGTAEGSKLFLWGDGRGDCEDEGTSSRLRRTGMYPELGCKHFQDQAPSLTRFRTGLFRVGPPLTKVTVTVDIFEYDF